jgi:hypothetical protein
MSERRTTERRNPMNRIVDVGAFQCPAWFAEGLMALIALEAASQCKCSKEKADKEATDWLVANGFEPRRG